MTINTLSTSNTYNTVDFSYYPSSGSLQVLPPSGDDPIPPYGFTTLAANLTTQSNTTTSFSITGVNTANFVGGPGANAAGTAFGNVPGQYPSPIGTLYVYNTNNNQWALIGYTVGPADQAPVTGTNFNYCFVIDGYNGGTNLTFTIGSGPIYIYDPRWATYTIPLSNTAVSNVTFDAIDISHLGLPNSKNANIVSYHWDFGNGLQADGPVVETQYWYTGNLTYSSETLTAPTEIVATLTAIDINNNIYYVTHPVIFT